MTDVKFEEDSNGVFDFDIVDGDMEHEDGLDTSLWISLLTDARADKTQVKYPEYRRGWLGDIASEIQGRLIGSHLYLLEQKRLTAKTLNEAIDYTRKCLNWYVEDGICKSVDVTGEIIPKLGIALTVSITSVNGDTHRKYRIMEGDW